MWGHCLYTGWTNKSCLHGGNRYIMQGALQRCEVQQSDQSKPKVQADLCSPSAALTTAYQQYLQFSLSLKSLANSGRCCWHLGTCIKEFCRHDLLSLNSSCQALTGRVTGWVVWLSADTVPFGMTQTSHFHVNTRGPQWKGKAEPG